ncbi:MAG: hypothetical protein JRH20_06860 [Deltaproteobacteria bacterium]|nr:hypothetical protein [Deltaproteobacteria bacterium]
MPEPVGHLAGQRAVWLKSLLWAKLRPERRPLAQKLTRLVFIVFGLAIATGIYFTATWFLDLAYHVEVIGPLLCQRLLDMLLLVLLSVLLLSNIVTSLSSFFLAKDLELLMAAPVPPRVLFGARFAEQVVHSSWMVLAFGAPVLLAFAQVAGTPKSMLAILVTIPPLLVIPAALGAALTMMLVSSLPAARARDLVVALLFVGFIVLYLMLRLIEPERFLNPEGFASMVSFIASFSSPTGSYLPSHWAAAVIADTFRGAPGGRQVPLMLAALWTGAGACYALAGLLFRGVYARAYSRTQQGRKVARLSRIWARLRGRPLPADGEIRTPGRHGAESDWLRIVGAFAPRGAVREFLIKDLKLLVRDASQWSQLVLLAALVFVYLYNFRHFRQLGDSGIVGPLALFLVGLGLSGFVTTAVSVRFAYPLISIEGRMLWLLITAPIKPRQILRAKWGSVLPALVIVAEVMSLASSWILGQPPSMMILGATVALLTALGVSAVSIGVGALMPEYRAESAAKVAASFGGLVCMSMAMVTALAIVAWAVYPAYLLHYGKATRALPFVLAGGGALLTTALAVWLPLWLGGRALDRFEL